MLCVQYAVVLHTSMLIENVTYVVRCAYWYAVIPRTSMLIENVNYVVRCAYWYAVVLRTSTLIENLTYVELPTTVYWYAVKNDKDKPTVPTITANTY
jgi:hypothetical protein